VPSFSTDFVVYNRGDAQVGVAADGNERAHLVPLKESSSGIMFMCYFCLTSSSLPFDRCPAGSRGLFAFADQVVSCAEIQAGKAEQEGYGLGGQQKGYAP
jgi:hypothetical protein